MDLSLTVSFDNVDHRVAWIGFQPDDGSVSVGLTDRAFFAAGNAGSYGLWSAYNRVETQFLIPNSSEALQSISNPHFTFHPPYTFHLTDNHKNVIFDGIADLSFTLMQDGAFRWLRFISKPISTIPQAGPLKHPERTEIERIFAPDAECSIGIGVDFISAEKKVGHIPDLLFDKLIPWNGYFVWIHAIALAPQVARLSWFDQR